MKVELIKAYCKKTGKKFCLEINKEGTEKKVVNFIELTEEENKFLKSTISLSKLVTKDTLLPCRCGKRTVGGCNCPKLQRRCKNTDKYNFQCVYCNELEIEKPKAKNLKIYVTSPKFDNIAEVLKSMKVNYEAFNGKFDCDILFINCGTTDVILGSSLKEYVHNGGQVYLSDLASKYVTEAFPNMATFVNNTKACKLTATVEDPDLIQYIGKEITVELDLSAWSLITSTKANVLLRSKGSIKELQAKGKPLMISFNYGKGKVFYTSFHNHRQASQSEKTLLQVLVLKQMAEKAEMSIEDMNRLIGLNLKIK